MTRQVKTRANLSHDVLNDVNLLLREETQQDNIRAGAMILDVIEKPGKFTTGDKTMTFLTGFYKELLNQDLYLECATLLFGRLKFDARPFCARKVYEKFKESNKLIIIGGSSLSKSFTIGVMGTLDYIRDPEYTKIRVAAPNAEHLKANLFGHMIDMVRTSAIPLGPPPVVER